MCLVVRIDNGSLSKNRDVGIGARFACGEQQQSGTRASWSAFGMIVTIPLSQLGHIACIPGYLQQPHDAGGQLHDNLFPHLGLSDIPDRSLSSAKADAGDPILVTEPITVLLASI